MPPLDNSMSVCFFKVGRDIEFNLLLVSSLLSIFVLLLQSHYTFVIDDKFLNTAFYMAIFALMFTPDSSFLKKSYFLMNSGVLDSYGLIFASINSDS